MSAEEDREKFLMQFKNYKPGVSGVSKEHPPKVDLGELTVVGVDSDDQVEGEVSVKKEKKKKRKKGEKEVLRTRDIQAMQTVLDKNEQKQETEGKNVGADNEGVEKKVTVEQYLERKEVEPKTELPKRLSTSEGAGPAQVLSLDIIRRIIDSPEDAKVTIGGVERNIDLSLLDELDNKEDEKSGENFKALVKYFWADLGVHGKIEEDRDHGTIEGGKFPLKLKSKSDLDGQVCLELMKRAGIKIGEARYIYAGKELPGSLTMDSSAEKDGKKSDGITTIYEEVAVGGKKKWVVTTVVDHHSEYSKSDSSSSKYVYEGLVKLGLIEKKEVLDKLVAFTVWEDNGTPPREMEEVLKEYNEQNNTSLTKKEFYLQKWVNTPWALKRFIRLPKLIEFLDKGGEVTRVIEKDSDFKKLGVIYPDHRTREKKNVDLRVTLKENFEATLSVLEEIERSGMVFVSEKYGNIVVDLGRKMKGLGSQTCRDLGYDGYISWSPEDNSFAVWTRMPLEDSFGQGFKLREHMWVKKPKSNGELKMTLGDVIRVLKGNNKKTVWSHGLEEKSLGNKGSEKVKKTERVEAVLVWDDEVLKFLDEATKGKNSREKKAAFEKKLKEKGFVFKEKNPEEDEKLYAAIDACLLNKGNEKYKNPSEALAYLKEYFGVVEGEENAKKESASQKLEEKIEEMVVKKDRIGLVSMMVEGTDEKMFYWAVGIMTGSAPNVEFPTVEKAREYFMAHIKMDSLSEESEKMKDPEPEVKPEKAESRRMELGAMYAQYEEISMNKVLWKNWRDRIEAMDETSPEREYAIKQLQATIYLYNNMSERIKHADYWRETGMAIMRDLRAIEV